LVSVGMVELSGGGSSLSSQLIKQNATINAIIPKNTFFLIKPS